MPRARTLIEYTGDELNAMGLAILVEMWDKVVTPGQRSGSKYRKYVAEFSEAERERIREFHNWAYRWWLVEGYPDKKLFEPATVHLMERAVGFFASV